MDRFHFMKNPTSQIQTSLVCYYHHTTEKSVTSQNSKNSRHTFLVLKGGQLGRLSAEVKSRVRHPEPPQNNGQESQYLRWTAVNVGMRVHCAILKQASIVLHHGLS